MAYDIFTTTTTYVHYTIVIPFN